MQVNDNSCKKELQLHATHTLFSIALRFSAHLTNMSFSKVHEDFKCRGADGVPANALAYLCHDHTYNTLAVVVCHFDCNPSFNPSTVSEIQNAEL